MERLIEIIKHNRCNDENFYQLKRGILHYFNILFLIFQVI